jgi:acyl-CoA thioester hydrolase
VRHTYECQLRWADMDLLGHVNNVTYLDYLQEARIDMLLTHAPDERLTALAEGGQILSHEVQYAAPLTFRLRPVRIDTWVTAIDGDTFTLAHEVYDAPRDEGGPRTVYLRARSVLAFFDYQSDQRRALTDDNRGVLETFREADPMGERAPLSEARDAAYGDYAIRVRFSDLDAFGVVDEVQYFEFFQEARIDYLTRAWKASGVTMDRAPMVIAQMDVDYREPIRFRTEPFQVRSWVSRVGGSSFVIESELFDGDTAYSRARVVLVTFDPVTQKAAPAPEALRKLLLAQLP